MRAVDREAAWQKSVQRLGEFMGSLEELVDQGTPPGTRMVGLTVRLSTEGRPETLIVLKASGEGGAWVAFVGALDLAQALHTWRAKVTARSIKWREDVPYVQRAAGSRGEGV